MKIRSKALYQYLLKSGLKHGTEEDIAEAKLEYRRIYKKQWKQTKRPRKEIRIEVTLRQLAAVKIKAAELGLPHTTYARKVILSAVESKQDIPNVAKLRQVLQIISMTAIASAKNTIPMQYLSEQLTKAENMLLQYIKM